ncbi:MAG: FAD-linked oxidase C-terminal domain-containing protein [Sutterellaceae bacterium]|nr:FAD-binding protein [Burkholderiaceae bacterium]MDW8429965.1 FAD-linked oxidase C-terminal domain-containing protein [Sutterellaceae bacterium]
MNAPASLTALRRPLPEAFAERLRATFGAKVSFAAAVREHHGRDESAYAPIPPDAVLFAESTDDVAALVRLAGEYRVPVIPFGVGSSLEGHLLAVQGGVSVDLSKMNRVLAVHPEDLTVTVQPGVTRKQLNEELKSTGFFFPIDPGADATIGGMTATRASGTNAVRYGTMRENVLALEVVTGEGKVIRTARRAKKSSAGYDLTRLFVGSEGTLGVITEITLRIYPLPEAISAAICSFPTVDAAVRTTIATIQLGVPIARCELLDALTVKAVNAHAKLALPQMPLLLFEFHGSASSVREQAETVQMIAKEHGGREFQWATTPEERTRLWSARHNAYFSCLQLKPGCRCSTTDVCVPISRLAECIGETIKDVEQSGLLAPILGHVGDGNFHCAILLDPNDPREVEAAEALNRRIVARALAADGTCTGEHGIGLHKMDFLPQELGADAIDLMARIKRAFDPLDILNPGKVLYL